MPLALPGPLVTTKWLADHLHDDNLVLLDGSDCGSGVATGPARLAVDA